MTGDAPDLPDIRRRWSVNATLACVGTGGLAGAVVLFWVGGIRQQQWLDTVRAAKCRDVPPLPDLTATDWGGVGLFALATVCLACLASLPRRGARRVWARRTVAALLAAAAFAGLLVGGVAAATRPTSPSQGVDGSGLPCGGG
ncbi:hypothetical protein [Actinocrispum wychmicini]|uniref:Uncharacterized protein n=1 Tax=Actinocrispum wychmicini TaxID=1213861 RepID=A0A4V2S537_9PSEU|nr:hypothetical protein [Actinocrispum wychmicini]TCO50660.1 hypothetical protein EV192_11337 [Actinocrispum wychmicini]